MHITFSFLISWIKWFILGLLGSCALLLPLIFQHEKSRVETIKARESTNLAIADQAIQSQFKERAGDIAVLAHAPSVQRYLDHPENNYEQDEISRLFQSVCITNGQYDQIRMIRLDGQELVRINKMNGRCVEVPQAELQNKADRYYFSETAQLTPGQIFVSPLDLNMEFGRVEEPHKPMIRFTMPVADRQGKIKAALTTNYLAQSLLATVFQTKDAKRAPHTNYNDFLVNSQGYYLINTERPDRTFGFMFGHDQERFDKDYPDIWRAMQTGKTELITDAGLYLIKTLQVPISPFTVTGTDVDAAPTGTWHAVHLITKSFLYRTSNLYGPYRWVWFGIYVFVVGLVSLLWVAFKNREDSLIESARMIQVLFDEAPEGILTVAEAGSITTANASACQMFGYQHAELIGRNVDNLLPDHAEVALLNRPVNRDLSMPGDLYGQRKDGSAFPINISLKAATLHGKKQVICSILDVTERKSSERALKASEEKLRALYELSHLGIALTDMQGHYIEFNKAFRDICGYSKEELNTLDYWQLTPKKYEEDEKRQLESLAETGYYGPYEKEYQRKDGSLIPLCLNGMLVTGSDGKQYIWSFVEDISERKAAERELTRLNENYQTLFNNSPDGYLIVRVSDNVILQCNKNAAALFGGAEEQLIGKTAIELSPELQANGEPSEIAGSNIISLALSKGHSTFEWRHTRLDGAPLDVEVTLSVITFQDQDVFLCALRDIAERKSFESRLRRSEQELNKAQAVAHIGSWTLNFDRGRFTMSNETAKLFDLETSDSTNFVDWFARIHPDDRKNAETAWRTALHGSPYDITYRIVVRGEVVWIHALAEFEFDRQGSPLRAVGTVQDISELKQSEKRLALYQTMFELAQDAFYMVDMDDGGRMVLVNAAAEAHYGAPRETIYKWHLPDWDPNFDEANLPQLFEQISKGEKILIQTEHRVHGGTLIPVEVSINYYVDDSDRHYTFGWFRNITERLENQRLLQQAKDQAESANLAKSAFLATMSHEIRTPLNAIIGTTYLLSLSQLTDQQRDDLGVIESSSKNLLALINDVLDFSKIEAGELTIDPHVFSLNEVLHDLRPMFAGTAAAKGIYFEIADLPGEIPPALVGDDNRLRQMLINLLGNALKFTAQGSVKLQVQVADNSYQNNLLRLRFTVVDTGIGIEKEALPNLFTPFIQADQTTSRFYGGTGLGLSIVKRLAERMRGDIAVESTPGQGSIFSLELPFSVSDAGKLSHCDPISSRQIQILVAEDDPTDRRVLIQLCGSFGWNVESVDNGRDMVDQVMTRLKQNHPFDCIVLDWHMPVMDGLAALAELKQTLDKRMPSVIMVTAHDIESLNSVLSDAKPDSVLVKPIEPSCLFNNVNEAVVSHSADLDYLLSGTLIDSGHSHWLDGLRILAVDDSRINLMVIERALLNEGTLPTTCISGEAALEAINQEGVSFDLVLMDLQMPGMDGCEATRRIRADGRCKNLPILALTAGATTTEQRRAMESGMNGFLTKPITPPSMVRAIRYHVEKYRGVSLPLVASSGPPSAMDTGRLELRATSNEQGNWPEIDGIDSACSKDIMQGDIELLIELLKIFVTQNAKASAEIRTLFESNNYDKAAKQTHKVGGQLGNIGAIELHQMARSLERALQTNTEDIEETLLAFDAGLTKLLSHIDKTLANLTKPHTE